MTDAEWRRIGECLYALRRIMNDAKASRSARARARAALTQALLTMVIESAPEVLSSSDPIDIEVKFGTQRLVMRATPQ